MTLKCDVFALPQLADADDLRGVTAVVIDVLRASTTIIHALAAGATAVIACREVDEARQWRAQLSEDDVVLGGERGGLPIEGFDLGNSPDEYSPDRVGGRTVVLTTTNGTAAIEHARKAEIVLIGAFVNASAVFRHLLTADRIALICAGTDGQYSLDDLLAAGYWVNRLQRESGLTIAYNAQALTAQEAWRTRFSPYETAGDGAISPDSLAAQLRNTPGGANLIRVGLAEDILTAAQIDRFSVVPMVEPIDGRIRPASPLMLDG